MIIKSVHLRNIRSYIDEKIDFDRGVILFEGDIGSGKTSILMAVDFALFGNSTRDFYERLLRKGAQKGSVEIVFEHKGEKYRVYRELEKIGGRISNTESYVETPEGKIKLGVSDIKHYILRVMGVDVDTKKKKSLPLVKYAIYTPQETMKEILEGNKDERLDVIRRIFKLDEYKNAKENASIIAKELHRKEERVADLKGDIEDIKIELEEKKEEIKGIESEILALERKLEEERRKLEDLKDKWKKVQHKRNRYEELRRKKVEINARLESMERHIERLKDEIEEIGSKKNRLTEIEDEARRYEVLEKRKKEKEEVREELNKIEKEIRASQERLKYLREIIERGEKSKRKMREIEEKLGYLERELERRGELEKRRGELSETRTSLLGKIAHLNQKIMELEKEREEYEQLGAICPKCKRPLTAEHKRKLIEENMREEDEIREKIKGLSVEKAKIEKELRAVEREIEEMNERVKIVISLRKDLENAKQDVEKAEESRIEAEEIEKKIGEFDLSHLQRVREELESIEDEMNRLKPLWMEYNALKREIQREVKLRKDLENAEKERGIIKDDMAKIMAEINSLGYSQEEYDGINQEYREISGIVQSINAELREKKKRREMLEREIKEKMSRLKEKEEELKFYNKIVEFGRWMKDKFVPALEDIEKMRMLAINEEFRALFEDWFHELLGESEYEATIDEDFRPVIRYQRFDMPLNTLSGGERTSVALAYRLALNTMVKRALGLDTNLLILDEPTDGFSKDQLYKLKDVFDKMETDQIIIVSHEKELMNLADRVYHVEKVNGVSKIRIV